MKTTILLITGLILAAQWVLVDNANAGEIYKTVDANGNVVYTDQQPKNGTKPVTLRELSIVPRPEYSGDKPEGQPADGEQQLSLRQLKQMYRGFRLVSPGPDETFWGTGNQATISWSSPLALQPGMQVQMYLDGNRSQPTTNTSIVTPPLDRGEHRVRADLITADNEVVASSGAVTFHVKQQSIRGGGGG